MPSERFQFGPFTLDLGRYELSRNGKPIRLERIPMDLLILLVGEGGKLVRREEIIERLWGKDVFFDADNGINTAIRKIRRALGEDPDRPQYIETVPGKGYRFRASTNGGVAGDAETAKPRIMLAILPFENLSGDPGQEYFSDGLTEETITSLGKMSPSRMGVIARTSAMAYKHTRKSIREIGVELGVDYVLEGSMRREPERIRVTAQLIRVSDQIHLWAENFDRSPQGLLDIQGEIAAAIAAQVRLQLTPEEQDHLRSPRRANQDAYDHYLRGRYHWARITYPELLKAADYFRKATECDSDFTAAYSGLADTLMVMPISSDVEPATVFPEAKSAIATSLRLDPNSAEAHTSDATAKFWYDWDFRAAERSARKAITLNHNYALAHLYLAHILSNVGRHEEALAAIEQARLLDPFSLITNTMFGQFLYHAGRVHEAIAQFRSTLELEGRFWVAHLCLAKALEKLGLNEEALSACEKALQFSGGNSEAVSLAGYIYAVSGNVTKAKSHIKTLLTQKEKRYVPPYNVALIFAGLRREEEALDWLWQAFDERDVHIPFLLDHKWDCLRSHPRFAKLAKLWTAASAKVASTS